ncbi:MAG: hypothetical protein RR436_04715 [Clostridia bacterium]
MNEFLNKFKKIPQYVVVLILVVVALVSAILYLVLKSDKLKGNADSENDIRISDKNVISSSSGSPEKIENKKSESSLGEKQSSSKNEDNKPKKEPSSNKKEEKPQSSENTNEKMYTKQEIEDILNATKPNIKDEESNSENPETSQPNIENENIELKELLKNHYDISERIKANTIKRDLEYNAFLENNSHSLAQFYECLREIEKDEKALSLISEKIKNLNNQ